MSKDLVKKVQQALVDYEIVPNVDMDDWLAPICAEYGNAAVFNTLIKLQHSATIAMSRVFENALEE